MKEPIWVREDVVYALHRRQIAEHGGEDGIRDHGLLQSALLRPQNLYLYSEGRADLASLAASYAAALTQNHPFIDGNKRVSFIVCHLFLRLNGGDLVAPSIEKYQAFMHLASSSLSEEALAEWLRTRIAGL